MESSTVMMWVTVLYSVYYYYYYCKMLFSTLK